MLDLNAFAAIGVSLHRAEDTALVNACILERDGELAKVLDAPPTTMVQPPLPLVTGGNKGKRERDARTLYCGNLRDSSGLAGFEDVDSHKVSAFFSGLLKQLPEYQAKYGTLPNPVKDVRLGDRKNFAFVEFWFEDLCATALEFNRCGFQGREIRVNRPAGFVEVPGMAKPMDVSMLKMSGVIPSGPPTATVAAVVDPARRAREMYLGNLPEGQMTAEAVRELIAPACLVHPAFNSLLGDPVLGVRMPTTKYCFVELQSPELAQAAVQLFNGMEVFGRRLTAQSHALMPDESALVKAPSAGVLGFGGVL
mmetsp:Transcript_129917/g.296180  ORF Transcript_129917/g.296180 Transcript_129917/m.296180 type:complete len:309 (+) Transcript_129917:3-929(+)